MTDVLPERPSTMAGSPASAPEAVVRIESWLLHSDVQLGEGPQRGGVAGWLRHDGDPEFVYLEITGYYLTTMAWLSAGAACSPHNAAVATANARAGVDWIDRLLARHEHPPTRLYVSGEQPDWRNQAVFTFDLAMAARGVAAVDEPSGRATRTRVLAELAGRLARISGDSALVQSHEELPDSHPLPERWSTRPGPHHLKAAAATLAIPEPLLPRTLGLQAWRTSRFWAEPLRQGRWPCDELHALLYGIEGMLVIGERDSSDDLLDAAEAAFVRLMAGQAEDGTLPEFLRGGIIRSDVLAQALRAGMLLRGRGRLPGTQWQARLDALAGALLTFVRPDGGVLFARHQDVSNTWCAMFAHQALRLYVARGAEERTLRAAYQLLV